MALSDTEVEVIHFKEFGYVATGLGQFARAIEAEVRKQDDALILQLVEALEDSNATLWEEEDDPERPAHAAIAAGRARLESKP